MSSDLQPVYTASAEINHGHQGETVATGYGLFFAKGDKRNQGGRVKGDTFDAELRAIDELLLFALKEGAYGYKVYTTNQKALDHIKRGSHHADPAVLSEIHNNLSRCAHHKVDIDFVLAESKDEIDNIHEAEKLAAEGASHK